MHHHKYHLHLNWTIIILMAAVSILPVLAVGISAYKIATDTIQDEVKNVSQEFVEQQYIKIKQAQQKAYALLVALGDNYEIKNHFYDSSSDYNSMAEPISQKQLQLILSQITNNPWVESIDLVTLDGRVITSRENTIVENLSSEEIDYYIHTTTADPKGMFYEGIKRIASSGIPDKSRIALIKLIKDLRIDNTPNDLLGFVVLNFSIQKVYEDLTLFRFGNNSQIYISDASDQILLSNDHTIIGSKLSTDIVKNTAGDRGNLITMLDGVPSYLTYLRLDPSDWTVIQTVPTAMVEKKVTGITQSLGMVLIISLLASIIIGFSATSLLVRPISQIATSFMEIRKGKFDWKKRFKGSVIAEINELMHWFNDFIENEDDQQAVKLALHKSEERYKALFENSPVALWEEDFSKTIDGLKKIGLQGDSLREYLENHPSEVIDLMSKIIILDVNRATLQLYGIDNKPDLLKSTTQLFRNTSHEQLVDELMAMYEKVPEFEITVDNSNLEGKLMHVRVRWSVYPGYEQTMKKVIINTVDITQQTESNRVQAAIYRISQAASTTENLSELYHSIHNILGGLMPAKNFYIALYDEKEGMISFPYHVDEHDPHPEPRKFSNGWTEYVIRTGQPMLLSPNNVTQLEEEEGVKTVGTDSIDWLGVPLKVEDRVIGMLAVQTYTSGVRYTDLEKGILVFVSSQIAMAIERKRTEEKLKYSSTHEPLTGLYNRGYYEEETRRLASGRQSPVGAIVIDIDRLKAVNDQYGHSAGDELLITFAKVLQAEFRSCDVVARLGGDEFGILLPLSNMKTVERAVKRIEKSVDQYNQNNPRIPIYYSVGCCTTEDGKSVLEAINHADELMYKDKAGKRCQRS